MTFEGVVTGSRSRPTLGRGEVLREVLLAVLLLLGDVLQDLPGDLE